MQRISAAEEMAEIQASVSCHLLKNKKLELQIILRESQWKELDKISKNANFRKIEKWKRKLVEAKPLPGPDLILFLFKSS